MRRDKLLGLLALAVLVLFVTAGAGASTVGEASGPGPRGLITGVGILEPEAINPPGYGMPDSATLSFTIKGDTTAARRLPLDLVLIVDRSATIDLLRTYRAVEELLALLGPDDRIGLVSFADAAREDLQLMPLNQANKQTLLQTIAGFANQGKTDCRSGVALATQVLDQEGRERTLWAEVLLTDGFCTHGREPNEALVQAADQGIAPFVVGVGFVSQLFAERMKRLEQQAPGLLFFSAPARFQDFLDSKLEEIHGLAGKALELIVRLPSYISYAAAASEAPVSKVQVNDGSTIIQWERSRLGLGEAWVVSFKIKARRTGELTPAEAELRFKNPLSDGLMPAVDISVSQLQVHNVPPICDFSFEPAKPTIADDVNFFDHSYDPFGDTIVSWEWDFGDGSGSAVRNPTHRYSKAGNYQVSLKVTDSAGASCQRTKTIEIGLVAALPTRAILTFPHGTLLPGMDYTATVRIEPQMEINGLGLKEIYPPGWEITPVENGDAQFKAPNEWVWQGPIPAGDTGVKTVKYKFSVPASASSGAYSISGTVSSFAPRFEIGVKGITSVNVADHLELKVAVACLNTETQQPDPGACYDEQGQAVISQEQIEAAKKYYNTGEPVPGSGGQTIDYTMLLELLAYYETGTPVTQPLPGS